MNPKNSYLTNIKYLYLIILFLVLVICVLIGFIAIVLIVTQSKQNEKKCIYNDKSYFEGEVIDASDSCNKCICNKGKLICTDAKCDLLAITPTNKPTPIDPQTINTEEKCLDQGGRWGTWGLSPIESCILPTSDEGKSCKDSDECESICLAPEGAEDGEKATGKCYGYSMLFGCYGYVEKGIVYTLCVD